MSLSNWIGYDPYYDVHDIHNQVDDIFTGFLNNNNNQQVGRGQQGGQQQGGNQQRQHRNKAWLPVVDVKENDGGITIHAELPGIKKEDIHLDVNDGILTLSGEKKDVKKEDNERYHRYVL
jgi:HSP20 family molecular chaperone IbpA